MKTGNHSAKVGWYQPMKVSKIVFFPLGLDTVRSRVLLYALPVLLGLVLSALVLFLPQDYLLFAIGGLIFVYLLIFKIEVAIIIALFIQNQLTRFNYMGQGTPFHPNGIMGLGLIAGAMFYFLFHKIKISRLRSISGFFVYLLISAASLANAGVYMRDSFEIFLRLMAAFSIYAVLVHKLDSITTIKWVLVAVLGAQIFPVISRLLERAGQTGLAFTGETMRLGNSGIGVYLSMISVICVIFLFNQKKLLNWLCWAGLMTLFVIGLYFSFGRSGWIGFVFALLMISIIRYKRLIFILPLILILLLLIIPGFSQRFADISLSNDSSDSTLSGRIEVWKAALELYPNRPILGVGFGIGNYVIGDYLNQSSGLIHNDYISTLIETGILGLIFFLFWHGQWLVTVIKDYLMSEAGFDRTMLLAVLVVLTSSLVMRVTDNILIDSYDMYPICALVASALSILQIRNQQKATIAAALPEPAGTD
ncbi:MAG: O-antigen ligase family protein [Anaerolineales bacterium]|nr:O-antigen ligase family protein [Anaerolineales bacterium]